MKKLIKSIGFAFEGILYLCKKERNFKIQSVMAILTVGFGFWLNISFTEWILVVLCITLVFAAEAFNTAIEKLCDALHPDISPKIKVVKDLSAASALLISIGVVIGGLIIFVPKLILKLSLIL